MLDDAIALSLGLKPGSGIPQDERMLLDKIQTNPITKGMVQAWIIKNGIPAKMSHSALPKSLASAYVHKPYLKAWRTRVNPAFDLLSDDSDDDTAFSGQSNVPPPEAKEEAQTVSADMLKDLMQKVDAAIEQKIANAKLQLDEGAKLQIRVLAKNAAQERIDELAKPQVIEIHDQKKGEVLSLGLQHECFPKLLRAVQAKDHKGYHLNIWLTGPTGSGKTTAAQNVAKALGFEFEAESSLDADYKITGFYNANGTYMETAFFRRYTQGGVILLDEIDNYSPSALLAVNSATANSFAQFPNGHFERHKDCIIIACANTWGLGATGDYVGRTRLDAASLDRFQPKINWPIDERLERAVAEQQGLHLGLEWHNLVQSARRKAKEQGLKIIISPRATFSGISLLQQGFTIDETLDMTICAGLSAEQRKAIGLNGERSAHSQWRA